MDCDDPDLEAFESNLRAIIRASCRTRTTRQGIVETADSRQCTGKIGEQMTVEKMKRCS